MTRVTLSSAVDWSDDQVRTHWARVAQARAQCADKLRVVIHRAVDELAEGRDPRGVAQRMRRLLDQMPGSDGWDS